METAEQRRRTYKELFKQLNEAATVSEVVAIRKLRSGDIMITIKDEQACTT